MFQSTGVPPYAPTSRFQPNSAEIAAEVVDGEAILINLTTGVYYSMSDAAGLIWTLIQQRQPVETMIASLTACYEVSDGQASADIERLLDSLAHEQIILPATAEPDPLTVREGGEKRLYAGLELSIYRDMGVLLALDPPMPDLPDAHTPEFTSLQSPPRDAPTVPH